MPGPPGIGQDVHHIHPPGSPPQMSQIRNQAKDSAQHGNTAHPLRLIRTVGSYEFNVNTFRLEQQDKLLALVRHTARRWRQRSDQANTRQRVRCRRFQFACCAIDHLVPRWAWKKRRAGDAGLAPPQPNKIALRASPEMPPTQQRTDACADATSHWPGGGWPR